MYVFFWPREDEFFTAPGAFFGGDLPAIGLGTDQQRTRTVVFSAFDI